MSIYDRLDDLETSMAIVAFEAINEHNDVARVLHILAKKVENMDQTIKRLSGELEKLNELRVS